MAEENITSGEMGGHDNLRFPTTVILKETDLIRKLADAIFVHRHNDGTFHHATIRLTKFKRTSKRHGWPSQPETYTLEDKEITDFHQFIANIEKLREVPVGVEYVLISGGAGVRQLSTAEGRALIDLLLDAVRSNSLDVLLRLANLDVSILESLSAATRHAQYKRELAEFTKLVEGNALVLPRFHGGKVKRQSASVVVDIVARTLQG